jgi:transcriptional regulator with XRE-family HTH domain
MTPNHHELANFLRSRRERLLPETLGLPGGKRRRTPGLRREEVAQIAGVSLTWYTWLEQARPIRVSAQVLESIANALRLEAHEKQYLFSLAFDTPSPATPPFEQISPALQQLLDHQGVYPAYILGRIWDIVGWNRAAYHLFGDFDALPERNLLWYMFVRQETRQLVINWEDRARRLMAEFRADCHSYFGELWFTAYIDRIAANSAEFAAWWPQHEVLNRRGGRRDFDHPLVGKLALEQVSLQVSGTPTLKFYVLMPLPEFDSAEKLQTLNATNFP